MNTPSALRAIGIAAVLSVGGAAQANTFLLTYEAPGVQNSTATFSAVGVETFDSRPAGSGESFNSVFGNTGITGSYSGVDIRTPDQYGGAGGTTNFASTESSAGYALTLDQPVNYFGFWLSALDGGNIVSFYDVGNLVATFNAGSILSAAVQSNGAYYGNPNANFLGQNNGQAYAFVNFYSTTGTFDEVKFSEDPEIGGYESDNHTAGIYKTITGTPTMVPEPGTWLLMVAGLGAIVGLHKRRRD